MKNFNFTGIEGRLTKDPEMTTAGELQICKMSIATNGFKEGDVSFFDVTCFKKLAETCGKYLKKGSHILVSGELKQDRWKNKEGQNRSKVAIIANNVNFLSPKKESETTSDYHPQTDFPCPAINFLEEDYQNDDTVPF